MLFLFALLAVAQAQFLPIAYKRYEYPLAYKTYKTFHTTPLVEKTLEVKSDAKAAHNFGFSTLNHARMENRDTEGNVEGSYSYISPEGKLIQRNYRANAFEGFKQDEKKYNPAIRTEVLHTPAYYSYPTTYSRSYKTYIEELARKKRDTYLAINRNWSPYYSNYRLYDNAWTMPAYRYIKYDDDDFKFYDDDDDDRKKRDTYLAYTRNYDWTPYYNYRTYTPTWTMPAYRYIKYDDDLFDDDRRKRDTSHAYAFSTPTQTQFHSQTNLDAKHMIYKSYEMPKTYIKSYNVPTMYRTLDYNTYRYGMPMYWY